MNVSQFIEWLKTKPQHLEVSVVHSWPTGEFIYDEDGNCTEIRDAEALIFDDPQTQSHQTDMCLILGVE